jgi:hypothetical protein
MPYIDYDLETNNLPLLDYFEEWLDDDDDEEERDSEYFKHDSLTFSFDDHEITIRHDSNEATLARLRKILDSFYNKLTSEERTKIYEGILEEAREKEIEMRPSPSLITREILIQIKKEIEKVKTRDKTIVEGIKSYQDIEKYKHIVSGDIFNSLGLDIEKSESLKSREYFHITSLIDKEILGNRVTSVKEFGRIESYISRIKKTLRFPLASDLENERKEQARQKVGRGEVVKKGRNDLRIDIRLKEEEYLQEQFYEVLERRYGINVDNINDPNVPLKLLIEAPMGSGKSTMLGVLSNVVILKDNILQVVNSAKDLEKQFPNKKVYVEYGDNHNDSFEEGSIIVSTYNQVVSLDSKLDEDWLFILDEEHKLVVELTYKRTTIEQVVSVLEKRGRYIGMSGTPLHFGPLSYDQHIVVIKESIKKRELVLLKEGTLEGKVFDYLLDKNYKKEDTTLFYVIQNTSVVERLSKEIRERFPNYNVCEITSDLVNSRIEGRKREGKDIMDNISSGGFQEYDIVISTPMLREGISLVTNRENAIFLIEDDPTLLTILQQHDRVRRASNVKVIILEKKKIEDKNGYFKGLYLIDTIRSKKLGKGEEIDFFGDLNFEDMKVKYRKGRMMVNNYYEFNVECNIDYLNKGLNSLKSNFLNNNISVIDYPNGEVVFLNKDFNQILDNYFIYEKLGRCFFDDVIRSLQLRKGFTFSYDVSNYQVDTKSNREIEKELRREKIEHGIEKIFNLSPNQLEAMRFDKRDKYTNEVYFLRTFLSKISIMDDDTMKDFIRKNGARGTKELIRDYLIYSGPSIESKDNLKNSYKIIGDGYLNEMNLKVEVKLATTLVVGETYSKEDLIDVLRKLGLDVKRPLVNIKKVFNVKDAQVWTNGKGSNKEWVYTILNKVVDSEDYIVKFNKEYLDKKIDSVYQLLEDNLRMEHEDVSSIFTYVNPFTNTKVTKSTKVTKVK